MNALATEISELSNLAQLTSLRASFANAQIPNQAILDMLDGFILEDLAKMRNPLQASLVPEGSYGFEDGKSYEWPTIKQLQRQNLEIVPLRLTWRGDHFDGVTVVGNPWVDVCDGNSFWLGILFATEHHEVEA